MKNTKKPYCVQNGDCRNNPVDKQEGAQEAGAIEIATITRERFESLMGQARTMQGLETDRAEYWIGIQRGLRRAYHGEAFGTAAEHALWLAAINHNDTMRQQRGQGYRDGLKSCILTG